MLDKVHLWLPDLPGSKGGIQMYSDHLLKAIESSGQVRKLRVIVKNDVAAPISLSNGSRTVHTAGRWPKGLRTIGFALLAAVLALHDRPTLILSVHANFAPWAATLHKILGVPYAVVAHGVEVWSLTRRRLRAALLGACRILPVSSFTRNKLLAQLPFDPSKLTILPNTVDSERFCLGTKPEYLIQRYGLSNKKIILTIARLANPERYKGYDQVLRALPAIRKAVPDVHYVLGGKGHDQARVERLITDLGLADCVTLAGFVSDDELPDHYRMADVFAMPSKGEGFGIVYLEAMACGKPVLGGTKDGATDALNHGAFGALVDPDNVEEIASALIQLLTQTYPNSLVFQPAELRAAMLQVFGSDRFCAKVSEFLQNPK